MKEKLSPHNFVMFAMKMYNNPHCSGIEEFKEDLSRIKYIKRLLIKYKKYGHLKERLILNHIIILQNVFGVEGCVRILFYKLNKDLHAPLKAFLEYLQYLPYEIPEADIHGINPDHRISKLLQRIK
jgi:hypothetical protein|tara:strand:+ start:395 stop:772 length:378 start_codon:yes stop_codon:yes gene_type:complete